MLRQSSFWDNSYKKAAGSALKKLKKAAQQLGIAYFTLADWRSIRRNTPPAKPLSAEEQIIRIRELERENAELRTANDILKDALGFFAKDRKK